MAKQTNEQPEIIYSMMRVSKIYNNKPVIKDISLSYFYGAKIGVLGLNGSGKSTVLRIMAGVDQDFNGSAVLSKGYTTGMLEQEPQARRSQDRARGRGGGRGREGGLAQGIQRHQRRLRGSGCRLSTSSGPAGRAAGQDRRRRLLGPGRPAGAGHGCPALPRSRRPPSRCSPGASGAVWPCAACSSRSPTSCSWTSPPTTWTPRPWPGWRSTCRNTRARSSP